MFDGTPRRIVSMWFPRLASDRALRLCPVEGPFALTGRAENTERIFCLNTHAEAQGLHRGMPFAEARAFCPDLRARPADPAGDARQLEGLRRWSLRYCPWAGREGTDGLVLDITGAAHLAGGEAALIADMRARLTRAGFGVRLGLGDTRGAAWALAHHGTGMAIAPPGQGAAVLAPLPVAALRLDDDTVTALQRLGLRTIGAVAQAARGPLARRFSPDLLARLDQALGRAPEAITPLAEPPHYGVRLTLPEPIGLTSDVMAGLARLLDRLCVRLRAQEAGARTLCLTLRRVDRESREVTLRLASAMRDPARILPLFARGVEEVDAGFGIDQLRLEAVGVEPMPVAQIGPAAEAPDRLDNLVTRIGTRIGLDNILRFQPADSHIPERSFTLIPAAGLAPGDPWPCAPRPRPVQLFPPEPVSVQGPTQGPAPPAAFRWRRMRFATARATGPERIAPEWWVPDPGWRSGLRDYWRVETRQGRRLWLFHTPQMGGWFVQGEFL
ncbi:DNA polymerase Y family protein [Sinirhodobacter populi]|uniref:DNA-directed DNA polymerase n=1 Tax=Paenirhodobacter populi TaxID=2306993 RepID=A0A443KBJ2_9RHOB|nr:DNA polymerase Y family protein [Sinirhodobacter populi]RWR30066.1 DNA polymerase Y family protein [Sinirhodobacter populi]